MDRVERVLLVHEYGGGFGGAERYLELLATGLVGRGVEVSLVVFHHDRDGGGDGARPLSERLEHGGVRVEVEAGRSRPTPIRRAVHAARPQVLHWNFVDPHAFQGASWLLLPWGVPSVITDHLPMVGAGPHRRATRAAANRRIAAAIVVGEAGRDAMAEAWSRPPRTVVVPNGVEPVPPSRRRPRGPAASPARLLFVGRLTDQKGVLDLPQIVAAVDGLGTPARLVVVGDGPLAGELRVAAGPAVELRGFLDDPRSAMADADLLLAPSRWEGLPFTPLEAMATGLPAVLSDIPPHRELADGGQAVQLAPLGEPQRWARAAIEVLGGLPAASQAALDLAAGRTVDHMVEQTLAVYDDVVAGR